MCPPYNGQLIRAMVPEQAGQADSFSATVSSDAQADTIAAIATACGPGGIGIVRISGPSAYTIAEIVFRPVARKCTEAEEPSFQPLPPHRLNYGHIVDPGDGRTIDEVLLAYMPGPRSYTREDVVEIQSHGGTAVLNHLLTLVLSCGARLAEPGEFTRRAFLNGRIDLSQAEAVADLICATSKCATLLAANQLKGGLRARIEHLLNAISDLSAEIEARIEFPDDFDEITNSGRIEKTLVDEIIAPVEHMIHGYETGRMMRDGIRVVIAGRPNVGKSSLFNRLIQAEKAIVTPIPGTTRDPVEARVTFRGISLCFSDTAGIHSSSDPIETIGICKSKEALADADLVLLMIDASKPDCSEDFDIYSSIQSRLSAVVVNKIDLTGGTENIHLPDRYRCLPFYFVCALDGTGIGALKEGILTLVMGDTGALRSTEAFIVNLRHKICLEEALANLKHSLAGLEAGASEDLIGLDLQHAGMALKRITGELIDYDLLDRIFEKFCIGK
jgi:tRNA modification GTPase